MLFFVLFSWPWHTVGSLSGCCRASQVIFYNCVCACVLMMMMMMMLLHYSLTLFFSRLLQTFPGAIWKAVHHAQEHAEAVWEHRQLFRLWPSFLERGGFLRGAGQLPHALHGEYTALLHSTYCACKRKPRRTVYTRARVGTHPTPLRVEEQNRRSKNPRKVFRLRKWNMFCGHLFWFYFCLVGPDRFHCFPFKFQHSSLKECSCAHLLCGFLPRVIF